MCHPSYQSRLFWLAFWTPMMIRDINQFLLSFSTLTEMLVRLFLIILSFILNLYYHFPFIWMFYRFLLPIGWIKLVPLVAVIEVYLAQLVASFTYNIHFSGSSSAFCWVFTVLVHFPRGRIKVPCCCMMFLITSSYSSLSWTNSSDQPSYGDFVCVCVVDFR